MDPFELVAQDHDDLRRLLAQYDHAREAGQAGPLAPILDEIGLVLERHTHLEEDLVYPMLAEHETLRDAVDDALDEHGEMRGLLDRVRGREPTAPDTVALTRQLVARVCAHLEEEERDLFALARATLAPADADELARQIDDARRAMSEGTGTRVRPGPGRRRNANETGPHEVVRLTGRGTTAFDRPSREQTRGR